MRSAQTKYGAFDVLLCCCCCRCIVLVLVHLFLLFLSHASSPFPPSHSTSMRKQFFPPFVFLSLSFQTHILINLPLVVVVVVVVVVFGGGSAIRIPVYI